MMPYERFEAWKLCDELALAVYRVTQAFPKHELYGLTAQARRAAFSAAVNIAERSEERRVGKSVDLGGRRIIKKKKKTKGWRRQIAEKQREWCDADMRLSA